MKAARQVVGVLTALVLVGLFGFAIVASFTGDGITDGERDTLVKLFTAPLVVLMTILLAISPDDRKKRRSR